LQVKSTDYVTRSGRGKWKDYDSSIAIAIHQTVVNLDYHDEETFVTRAVHRPRWVDHEHDIYNQDDPTEETMRYVAWGAKPNAEEPEFSCKYVQHIGGDKRDGLTASILKEARGEQLSIDEMNLLNGATHYLTALVRERME